MDIRERVVYDRMNRSKNDYLTLQDHLERYIYAMKYIYGRCVHDVASGTGYGSWLMSLGASKVVMVDKSEEALEYGNWLRFACPTKKIVVDLDKRPVHAKGDVLVTFETIEHLEKPELFLSKSKCSEIIFSVPIDHPGDEDYHKQIFRTEHQVLELLRDCGWKIEDTWYQNKKYLIGRGKRA